MIIGELFDRYEVDFPVEQDLSIIIGENGSFKTQTLLKLKEHFENLNEKVIYFPDYRTFEVTKDEITSVQLLLKLAHGKDPFTDYGIYINELQLLLSYYKKQINSGFLQVLNFFTTICLQENPIVLIDFPETNLHISIRRTFIEDILFYCKPKKLIVVTHSPEIISNFYDSVIEIEHCIKFVK